MIKHVFVMLFLGIFHYTLQAQEEDLQYPQMPINEITGEIKYTDVVQIGNSSPDELYKRCIRWFELYYNPKSVSSFKKPKYENPTSVIQVKDADKQIIIANASFQIYKTNAAAKEAEPVSAKGAAVKQKTDSTVTKTEPKAVEKPPDNKQPDSNTNPSSESQSEIPKEANKTLVGEVIYTFKIQCRDGRYKYEIYDIHWDKKSYFGIEQWLDEKSPNKTEYISFLNQTSSYFNSLIEDLLEGMQKSTEVPDENEW